MNSLPELTFLKFFKVKNIDHNIDDADKIILGMKCSDYLQKILLYVLIVVLGLTILIVVLAKLGFNWKFGSNANVSYP